MASSGTEQDEELQLVAAAQAGDHEAFDRLVERYQDQIYRLMVRACHHPQDAEEVASEAIVRAYERLRQFEGRSSFVTWLGTIATNLCFRRREKREVATVPLDDASGDSSDLSERLPTSELDGPEAEAMRAEMRRVLRDAVAELPEPDQTVLRLRDIEGLPALDVSRQTGLTVPAVKARLHRARGRLRERLNGYLFA